MRIEYGPDLGKKIAAFDAEVRANKFICTVCNEELDGDKFKIRIDRERINRAGEKCIDIYRLRCCATCMWKRAIEKYNKIKVRARGNYSESSKRRFAASIALKIYTCNTCGEQKTGDDFMITVRVTKALFGGTEVKFTVAARCRKCYNGQMRINTNKRKMKEIAKLFNIPTQPV